MSKRLQSEKRAVVESQALLCARHDALFACHEVAPTDRTLPDARPSVRHRSRRLWQITRVCTSHPCVKRTTVTQHFAATSQLREHTSQWVTGARSTVTRQTPQESNQNNSYKSAYLTLTTSRILKSNYLDRPLFPLGSVLEPYSVWILICVKRNSYM
jgi:hypothetical protein